jgi:hypothetical protein
VVGIQAAFNGWLRVQRGRLEAAGTRGWQPRLARSVDEVSERWDCVNGFQEAEA